MSDWTSSGELGIGSADMLAEVAGELNIDTKSCSETKIRKTGRGGEKMVAEAANYSDSRVGFLWEVLEGHG